jgi:hypothetical protein
VARLRSADLAGLGPAAVDAMPDGFVYTVRSGGRSVSVTEGETSGRRVALLDAAAAVVSSCVASRS